MREANTGESIPALPPRAVSDGPRMRVPWRGGRVQADWWPYVNLVYLFFAWLPLFFQRVVEPAELLATLAATALFLPLYFAFYRSGSRQQVWLAWAVAGIGFALMPWNLGGNTFVIYTIALCAHVLPVRSAIGTMLLLLALMGLQVSWIAPGGWPYVAITGTVGLMVLVGTAYARVDARRNAELRLNQEEVERLARSAERERIGRDLHDLLGHTLSLVAMKSELALKLFEREPARARVQMADVERITRDALAQVRRAVTGIRAAGIETELASARLGLLSAGVRMDYRLQPLALPVETETVLALALREGVTNVMRHARASRVEVELSGEERWATLVLSDDGRGGAIAPGNGLAGMRERIEALGGTLAIDAVPGTGTRLTLRVPRPPERGAALLHAVRGGGAPGPAA